MSTMQITKPTPANLVSLQGQPRGITTRSSHNRPIDLLNSALFNLKHIQLVPSLDLASFTQSLYWCVSASHNSTNNPDPFQ